MCVHDFFFVYIKFGCFIFFVDIVMKLKPEYEEEANKTIAPRK